MNTEMEICTATGVTGEAQVRIKKPLPEKGSEGSLSFKEKGKQGSEVLCVSGTNNVEL